MLKLFGGLFLGLTAVDMGIKQYVEDEFDKKEERETIIPKVVMRKVYNKGFAFNLLDKYPQIIRWSSAILTAVIAGYDVCLFSRKGRLLEKLGLVFVSAGAFSNTFDRLIRGKVIDYIGFKSKWKKVRTTTANLADFYVAIGAVLYLIANSFKK